MSEACGGSVGSQCVGITRILTGFSQLKNSLENSRERESESDIWKAQEKLSKLDVQTLGI